MSGGHTISMEGSKYGWDDVDKRTKELKLPMRSRYFQMLVENDLDGKDKKGKDVRLFDLIYVCLFFVIILLLMVVIL